MPANLQSAAMMIPAQQPVHAMFLEEDPPTSGEDDSHSAHEANCSALMDAHDSTRGVCNELARIAMSRSAIMQVYDSMFPRAEVPGATAARRSSLPELPRPGLVRRTLDLLFGRTPR
jgi:hypothetical protein